MKKSQLMKVREMAQSQGDEATVDKVNQVCAAAGWSAGRSQVGFECLLCDETGQAKGLVDIASLLSDQWSKQ